MYDNDVFKVSQKTVTEMSALNPFFNFLPAGAELRIVLDDRIPCTLKKTKDVVELLPQDSSRADFEILLFSESIRRLSSNPPKTLWALNKTFTELFLSGQVRYKVLSPYAEIYSKGYLHALRSLMPDVQKEFSTLTFTALTYANRIADSVKTLFRR